MSNRTGTLVTLSFPAKADYLLLARLALSGLARELELEDELLADLKLAVTEACGNAVRHAYAEGEGEVRVSYSLSDGAFRMRVEDQGVGIDPEAPAREPGTGLDGGMGFTIIRAVVDELDVGAGTDGRGTAVSMTKHLGPSVATPSADVPGRSE